MAIKPEIWAILSSGSLGISPPKNTAVIGVSKKSFSAALFVSLVGIFLILCAWETRARYFFQFEMILLCAGALLDSHKKNA